MDKRTVGRAIETLVAKGLVTVKHRYTADGRQTSNDYWVRRVPLGQAFNLRPVGTESHKEDSLQEASINTPSKMATRSWSHVSAEKPPTKAQLDYLVDLVVDFEVCSESSAKALIKGLNLNDQEAAHLAIRKVHTANLYRARYGKSSGFKLDDLLDDC
jgi:hypothetical protein